MRFSWLTARRLHLWLAIILALPMVLMALSGILIAMRSVAHIQVPMRWLGAETLPERLPITAYLELTDGSQWIGNAQGLTLVQANHPQPVAAFDGQEVVGLAALPGRATPVVATRMALWVEKDGAWQAVRRGRVRQLTNLADGRVLVISGGRGEMADSRPFVSLDGATWQPYGPALRANQTLPKLEDPKVALHQFMRELHSGAFFLGKGPGEMIWSNSLGWVLVTLTLTGLWIWWRRERQKAINRALAAAGQIPSGRVVAAKPARG